LPNPINKSSMKLKYFLAAPLTLALFAGCASEKHEHHHDKMAKLQAEAKISKEDATRTALAQVPNGTVKESELEKEKGKLIWSFDVATPDSKEIKEVAVDAMTGQVVSVETESSEKQAKEAAEDAKKRKDKDKDKD